MVGRGLLEDFLAVNANGRSRGVVIAWSETVFTKVSYRMGQFSVAIKVKRHSNDLEVVVVSIYGPTNVKRAELWGVTRGSD